MNDNVAQLLADSLLKVWSERDDEQRMNVMKRIYASDIVFYETDNGPAITGHQAIDSLIKTLQNQWPPEFAFTLTKPAVTNHGVSHVAWTLGAANAIPVASGMDIAIIESGLIKELYLYLDEPAT
ncbi:nuclear transport factor 2 family protein [Spirosoma validum]|uniref:Nuclear transport factor 2 family protein n=1 Tax=Spirosoma validum TaxID=2771355 RepID=A0A927B167_9BACT|nr:nuclear transport factor 2 family protein [Spirosoma validum]MBD2753481.1 nuclear transport factor 2 family protein [Spirosoma validum]